MHMGGEGGPGCELLTSMPTQRNASLHPIPSHLSCPSRRVHLLQPVSQPSVLILGAVPLQLSAVRECGQHTLLGEPNAQLGLCYVHVCVCVCLCHGVQGGKAVLLKET